MQSMPSLLSTLNTDYPQFTFEEAEHFSWLPTRHTVTYALGHKNGSQLLLHELSHGLLGHNHYRRDVELLRMEREAWDKALQLAASYQITIDDELIETQLDTYRDWLHARSTCPTCTAIGYQTDTTTYECPACTTRWRVNEARICSLKRYKIETKKNPL